MKVWIPLLILFGASFCGGSGGPGSNKVDLAQNKSVLSDRKENLFSTEMKLLRQFTKKSQGIGISQNCLSWERPFKGHLVQLPCNEQGHLQLHQVAQSPSSLSLNVYRDRATFLRHLPHLQFSKVAFYEVKPYKYSNCQYEPPFDSCKNTHIC